MTRNIKASLLRAISLLAVIAVAITCLAACGEPKPNDDMKSGFYTTVAGVTADYSVDQGWWCVTKDGEMTTKGINELVLADGDKYEITYTIG